MKTKNCSLDSGFCENAQCSCLTGRKERPSKVVFVTRGQVDVCKQLVCLCSHVSDPDLSDVALCYCISGNLCHWFISTTPEVKNFHVHWRSLYNHGDKILSLTPASWLRPHMVKFKHTKREAKKKGNNIYLSLYFMTSFSDTKCTVLFSLRLTRSKPLIERKDWDRRGTHSSGEYHRRLLQTNSATCLLPTI